MACFQWMYQPYLCKTALPCESSQDMWVELKLVLPIDGTKIFVMGKIRKQIVLALCYQAVLSFLVEKCN